MTPEAGRSWREARFSYSPSFAEILRRLEGTLLVSTYQAGKLIAIGARDDGLGFNLHQFDQAMGVAKHGDTLAVGARGQIWFLRDNPGVAPMVEPRGSFDHCYLPRTVTVTGAIHCHELAWGAGDDGQPELWIVNTLFSCLAGLHPEYSFVPRWRPPFVSALAGEDRCHLNGLAMRDGRPSLVTVMAQTDEGGGWRAEKNRTGCVLEVPGGEVVTTGLAMPHSPRWHQGRTLVLNSGWGTLEMVEPGTGHRVVIARLPGFTRGLVCHDALAFVGLSRIRETHVFGGLPISERHAELKCGIAVVDMGSGQTVAMLEFQSGIEEIFDVQLLLGERSVAFGGGERGDREQVGDIWIVPPEHPAAKPPESAQSLNERGNALQDAGRQDEALEHYRRAVDADPQYVPALQNLGYVLIAQGLTEEGLESLRRAQAVTPLAMNRVLIATALPVIYESAEAARLRRERLQADVQALVDDGVQIDTERTLVPTNFFAAYQGENDRDLHANLGRIFKGRDMPTSARRTTNGGRRRIGFLSAYFRDHTIGRLNLGRIQKLDRERFEVIVLGASSSRDATALAFEHAGDRFVPIPRDPATARRVVHEQDLDLLFFCDVGMDALTYTLAFSRMAPVQCTTWGHPVTTGSPAMDYFVSSQLLEIAGAEAHYTEKLVRLPSLGTYYRRVEAPESVDARAALGLDETAHVYSCPQTLFKLHPTFDPLLAEILRRDPQGVLVLIEGRMPTWTRLLQERFERVMPDVVERIRWLPALPNPRYLELLASADVLLDPISFGGGNTSYEALGVGTPVVTLPGELMRTRITRALYAKTGYEELVTESPEQYIDTAVRLGTDPEFGAAARGRISSACDVLFEDEAEVRDLDAFFAEALGQP